MAMDKQEFLDLCPAFALGALEPEDHKRFLAMLAQANAEMRVAYAEAMHLAANLSLAAPSAVLSPEVEARLMARIQAEPVSAQVSASKTPARAWVSDAGKNGLERLLENVRIRFRFAAGFAVAAVVACLTLLVYVGSLRGTLGNQRAALQDQQASLTAKSQRIHILEDSLAQQTAMLDVIRSNQMQVAVMSGQSADPTGYGKILWDPIKKVAILHVSNLPPVPTGKDYQLWVIRDKKPVDAGVFQVRDNRQGGELYRIDKLVETDKTRINAFAVTLEPKGGLPQPSGKMYLLGSI
jgi:anti-sigma-K factor RskA